ncbi:amidohydrolase family protein [Puniceicoccus vermicola]|uniref:Amidohydrolase family protein n=1 Tax=Puniceicoccus vermicola TaxID=388746 RepID=A0A7X1E3V9_9BACT|nr:amidohydrolase family protein [Puniceicoccus vermicola]
MSALTPAPLIIDAHTHAFPKTAVADPAGWAAKQCEPHWQKLVVPEKGRPSLQGWVDQDAFLETMERDGINQAVLLGWYWENPESCQIHNEEMAQWLRDFPNRFRAMASVHPEGPSPSELVEWAVKNQFSGFGELLPSIQNSRLSEPFWSELAKLSSEAGLLFNFHVTEPVGRPHPGRTPTPLEDFEQFIAQNPDLKIILSHWGGGLFLHELNPYVRKLFRNVYYDCSASPLLYDSKIFATACEVVGPHKILFGSDFPLRLYPRKDQTPGWLRFLQEIRDQNLGSEQENQIFAGNAADLFHL